MQSSLASRGPLWNSRPPTDRTQPDGRPPHADLALSRPRHPADCRDPGGRAARRPPDTGGRPHHPGGAGGAPGRSPDPTGAWRSPHYPPQGRAGVGRRSGRPACHELRRDEQPAPGQPGAATVVAGSAGNRPPGGAPAFGGATSGRCRRNRPAAACGDRQPRQRAGHSGRLPRGGRARADRPARTALRNRGVSGRRGGLRHAGTLGAEDRPDRAGARPAGPGLAAPAAPATARPVRQPPAGRGPCPARCLDAAGRGTGQPPAPGRSPGTGAAGRGRAGCRSPRRP